MTRNYADEKTVAEAVRKVMITRPRVESQAELSRLVLKELRNSDPTVRVSTARIRKIAVSSGVVKLEIEYRETDRKFLPDVCPVCGNGMSAIINNTLTGEQTEIRRNCTVCPYSVGKNVMAPGKYAFLRTSTDVSDEEMRIRKLKKAASLLRSAERLIKEALEGTNFPQRAQNSKELIDQVINSKDMAGSIPNLEADIRGENHSDPLWTKSFSTPKYPDKKDI